jgi:hypothetical protein
MTSTPDRDLAAGDIKIKVKEAKGPSTRSGTYTFCYDCNKVLYNIWRDGAMAPGPRNKFFCTCDGEESPIVEQLVTVWDVDDVEKDPEVIKEIRKMVKDAEKFNDRRIAAK